MCKFCVQHADGDKWYEVARNYALKMYNYQKEEARKKRAEFIENKMAEVKEMMEQEETWGQTLICDYILTN